MAHYDAFISYSHARDRPLATALQSLMQRLGKPWWHRRALWLFRDDTSLSATPHLWGSIVAALNDSRFLVLMASPEAARSPWVDKEVKHWLATKSSETLLIALAAGDIAWNGEKGDFQWSDATPLPPALKGGLAAEPKWIDLRAFGEGNPDARDPKLLDAAADLAAAVHGIPKEDLLSRELQQQRRALRQAGAAIVMFALLAAFAGWQWRQAVLQRDRAEQTLVSATRGADQFVLDVAGKLRGAAGLPLALVGALLNDANGMLSELHARNAGSPDLVRSQARVLRETSQTLLAAGDAEQALAAGDQSRQLLAQLPTAETTNPTVQSEMALTDNRMGEALARLGRPADALDSFRRALLIREKLAASDKSPDAQAALASAYERTGDAAYLAGDGGKAEASGLYEKSFGLRDALAKAAPDDPGRQEALAVAYERLARIAGDRGEDPVDWYRKIVAIRKTLVKTEPKNMTYLASLGTSYDAMGAMLECSDEAIDALGKALEIRRKLVEETPDNADWQVKLAKSLERLASCDQDAKTRLSEAGDILARLDKDGRLPDAVRDLYNDIERRLQATSSP